MKFNKKAQQMIDWFLEKTKGKDEDDKIAFVYNLAMRDVEDFIDQMIKRNPSEAIALARLKNTMFPGLKIGDETK